jgi:hypothetical protein
MTKAIVPLTVSIFEQVQNQPAGIVIVITVSINHEPDVIGCYPLVGNILVLCWSSPFSQPETLLLKVEGQERCLLVQELLAAL